MLRRTFVALMLCGFLAACECTVIKRGAYGDVAESTNCDPNGNSSACGTKGNQNAGSNSEQTVSKTSRKLQGELEQNEVEEVASRKKKDKGYGNMLLYFLGASKLTMLYVLMNTVAAIAGKALITAKVALAIATAIALKKSLEHKENVAYEIIKHPHHTYEHTHSSSFDYDHHGGFGESDFGYRKRRKTYQ